MTATGCVLCRGSVSFAFQATDRNRRLSEQTFAYYRCDRCATLQLHPIPTDLDRYYTAEYYAIPADRSALVAASGAELYKREIVERFVPRGRLVEIGPAVGGFAAMMQDAGYETSAIEMDPECCRFLDSIVGIPVQQSDDPATALAAEQPVDVIALWHVIEHLSRPRELLAAAATALRPGGIVAFAAPNPESFQFRLFAERWTHLDAPRHLVLARAGTYARVGREFGLEPVLVTDQDAGTLHWNAFGWRESLAGFASNRYLRHALRLTGGAAARAMAPIDQRSRNGSTYTVVLRKPGG